MQMDSSYQVPQIMPKSKNFSLPFDKVMQAQYKQQSTQYIQSSHEDFSHQDMTTQHNLLAMQ